MADVLLLDTSSLFLRAHHALPPMNTRAGEPTSAIYGFSTLLLKLLREQRPTRLAFARDLAGPTFRHRDYADYKANRPSTPEVLRPQWARLDQLIRALQVPQLSAAGFEADDVLATAARRLAEAGDDVEIVSGDRDLFQTIAPRVRVCFVGARGQQPQLLDVAAIELRYGVAPRQLPSVFALVGEASDNLIGVPGIGNKTASQLVARYGTLSQLLENLDSVTPTKLREALRSARERIALNEHLARLVDDLDLGPGLLAAPITPSALAQTRALFEELEFKSLSARLDTLTLA
jgi:DNA polymerase I